MTYGGNSLQRSRNSTKGYKYFFSMNVTVSRIELVEKLFVEGAST